MAGKKINQYNRKIYKLTVALAISFLITPVLLSATSRPGLAQNEGGQPYQGNPNGQYPGQGYQQQGYSPQGQPAPAGQPESFNAQPMQQQQYQQPYQQQYQQPYQPPLQGQAAVIGAGTEFQ